MPKKKKLPFNETNLIRRYLIWCYKTTKEDVDRIDRYFTQHVVDRRLLDILSKSAKGNPVFAKKVEDFAQYTDMKQKNVLPKKYSDIGKKTLQPDYWYLTNRLAAIEQVIGEFLGHKELKAIQVLYEQEMTRRIIEAREHT